MQSMFETIKCRILTIILKILVKTYESMKHKTSILMHQTSHEMIFIAFLSSEDII